MIGHNDRERETERAAQYMVTEALEKLATSLAIYLTAGVHQPAENGRQATVLFLENMADAPLDVEEGEDCDSDEARSRALGRISEIIMRVRLAAHL